MSTWFSTIWLKLAGQTGVAPGRKAVAPTAESQRNDPTAAAGGDDPRIYTTNMGSQYVIPSEVLGSKAGQRALDQLKDAVTIEPDEDRSNP